MVKRGLFDCPRFCFAVLLILILPFTIWSQENAVEIKKSTDKVMIDGKAYYIHIVREGHTMYSISRVYGISQKEISRENPTAAFGLRVGQALKIPVEPIIEVEEKVPEPANFIYHRIEANQTVYSLSRMYGVREQEILNHNPGLVIDDIPIGTVIRIPGKVPIPEQEEPGPAGGRFVYHLVEKGETLYSLSRRYNVAIRDIRRVNNELKGGIRQGEYLRIPQEEPESVYSEQIVDAPAVQTDTEPHFIIEPATTDSFPGPEWLYGEETDSLELDDSTGFYDYRKTLEVALLLPFYLDENDQRIEVDTSEVNERGERKEKVSERDENWIYPRSYNYIEFYEGTLLALEALGEEGVNVNLSVFDTGRDSARVIEIVNEGLLRNMDLIIGPAFTMNLKPVAEYGRRNRIPVVSPLASRNVLIENNPYLFQIRPTFETEVEKLSAFISQYHDRNIVMIHPGDSLERDRIDYFKRRLFYYFSYCTFFNDVVFKEVIYRDEVTKMDTINSIEHALLEQNVNLIIVPSDNEAFVSRVVSNLNILSKNYPVMLVGYQSWQRFRNIELEYFYTLNLHICTPFLIDYEREKVKWFIKRFRSEFYTEPDPFSYAWQGYDIMYYFVSGVARYGRRFRNYYLRHQPALLQSEYQFSRTGRQGGLENKRYHLVRYTPEFEIVRVNRDEPLFLDEY